MLSCTKFTALKTSEISPMRFTKATILIQIVPVPFFWYILKLFLKIPIIGCCHFQFFK